MMDESGANELSDYNVFIFEKAVSTDTNVTLNNVNSETVTALIYSMGLVPLYLFTTKLFGNLFA